MDVDEFFGGRETSRVLFDALCMVVWSLGPAELKVTRSQVAFVCGRPFAWAWTPEMYRGRKAAPLVLTLGFRQRKESPRWKEIYEARPGRFTHHLELWDVEQLDDEVRGWLQEARKAAEG